MPPTQYYGEILKTLVCLTFADLQTDINNTQGNSPVSSLFFNSSFILLLWWMLSISIRYCDSLHLPLEGIMREISTEGRVCVSGIVKNKNKNKKTDKGRQKQKNSANKLR